MSMKATLLADEMPVEPEVTVEAFLEALWGIRPTASGPRLRPAPAPHPYEDGMVDWLHRLWGIGEVAR